MEMEMASRKRRGRNRTTKIRRKKAKKFTWHLVENVMKMAKS